MSTAKRVAKNSMWLFAGNISLRAISAIVIILLARRFGDSAFGDYSFALAVVSFFVLVSNFGLNSLLVRDIAKDKSKTEQQVHTAMTLKLWLALASLVLLFIVANIVTQNGMLRLVMYVFCIELIITGFSDTLRSVFQAHERMEYDTITRVIEKIIWAACMLLVIYGNLTLLNVALATLIASVFGLVVTTRILSKKIVNVGFSAKNTRIKSMFLEAYPFAVTGLFALVFFKIDQVMLGIMQTSQIVGWYSAAYKIIEVVAIFPNILLGALYPVFSKYHLESRRLLDKSFKISIRYLMMLGIPIGIGTVVLSEQIISVVYGSQYGESAMALRILIFASVMSFINAPIFNLFNAIGKQKTNTLNVGISAAANIIMNLVLIPSYSIIGAAIATVLSECIYFTLSAGALRGQGYDINPIMYAAKPLLAGMIMAAFAVALINLNIFLLIIASALVYFAALYVLNGISQEDIKLMKEVLLRKKTS